MHIEMYISYTLLSHMLNNSYRAIAFFVDKSNGKKKLDNECIRWSFLAIYSCICTVSLCRNYIYNGILQLYMACPKVNFLSCESVQVRDTSQGKNLTTAYKRIVYHFFHNEHAPPVARWLNDGNKNRQTRKYKMLAKEERKAEHRILSTFLAKRIYVIHSRTYIHYTTQSNMHVDK